MASIFITADLPPAVLLVGVVLGLGLSVVGGLYPAAPRGRARARPRRSAMNDRATAPAPRARTWSGSTPTATSTPCAGSRWRSRAGESVAITGPSGCGKTTLLHLLGGLDLPTSGTVEFEGRPLASIDLDAYRARRIGFVFQSFHLLPTLSALENVQVPMFEAPWPRSERRAAGRAAARRGRDVAPARPVPRPGSPSASASGWRSPGPWPTSPTALLADEPTGNLDSVNQDEVLKLLDRLRRERSLTLVVVTHSPEVAAACDRVVRMRDGRVVDP